MKRIRLATISVLIPLLTTGCATNAYKQFYHDQTGGRSLTQSPVVIPDEVARIVEGANPDEIAQAMAEQGYVMLGYSSFNGPMANQSDAIAFATAIHAEVVVVFSKFTNTVSGAMPITTPTSQTTYSTANATAYGSNGKSANAYANGTSTTYGTQTTYVPYSVSKFDQGAQFWIKAKTPIFGARVKDLSDERRRELASNHGVEIVVVIKGSPAFNADFMRGDVIKKIDEKEISLAKDYQELLVSLAGKSVEIEAVRNGRPFTKKVGMNAAPL